MSMNQRFFFLLGPLLVLAVTTVVSEGQAAPAQASLTVATLETNHFTNPLGIDRQDPCLAWTLSGSERGARQTAYRIQVSESRGAMRAGEEFVWDSGKVSSEESAHHEYEGPALDASTRYYWRVRVWDEDGEASAWSEIAWWEMGLLTPSDWDAEWIEPDWDKDAASSPQPSPMLRSEFEVDGEVASARLYVTSHGVYEMHLNGRRVGDRVFTPGWTSYDHRLQYQTYDVAELLRDGSNAIGAFLGDGWYRGYLGFEGDRAYYGDDLAMLAQLRVTYADGRTEVVIRTDGGWKVSTGPIRMSDLYMGETYDARREKSGWTEPGYDDDRWADVRSVSHDMDRLVGITAPPVKRVQELKPVDVIHTPEGDTLLDMGQNLVGWMRMEVEGESGTEVTLRHAEVLDKDGNFYTENLRDADQEVRYTLSGHGTEVYEPHFSFQGFRYVKVSGYPGEVDPENFTGVVLHSDMQPVGHFESSHPLINKLQHNIVWGQKGNFLDIPTDCPQRDERLGWTGDIQVFVRTANFNMETTGFLTKWLRDLEADQRDDGSVPHVIPNVLNEESAGAAGWADASTIVPWAMYQATGNERILETQYESMKGWVEFMRHRARQDSARYLWMNNFTFGDWLAYNTNQSDYPGATTDKDLVSTAYFARSADVMARAAETLGRTEDAQEYRQLFERVRKAFQSEFVTPRGRVTSSTQTSYVLALSFNLLPEDTRGIAGRRLAEDVRTRGHLTTGFLGTPDLMHMLSDNGNWKEAYDLLLRTDYPSWLYPVTRGATTIWERWDGIKPDSTFQDPGMNSFNHYAYGAIGEWLYKEVAGLTAAAPGYNEIRIAPHPGGGLTYARAVHRSQYGRVASSWQVQDGAFHLSATVPANTQATVRLPQANLDGVTEGGQSLTEAEGIERSKAEGDAVVIDVGSGTYTFTYDVNEEGLLGGHTEEAHEALGPFTADRTVGALIANAEARSVLEDALPDLMNSMWLSQTMGYPLTRANEVVPFEISDQEIRTVNQKLSQIE